MMPVRLRGHHFLCVLTYRGAGYTERFVARMTALVEAINAGAPVVLMAGADDICAGLTDKCRVDVQHDCRADKIRALDKLAVEAVSGVLKRDLTLANPLGKDDVAKLRQAYATGSIRKACHGCSWVGFCNQIVAEKFSETLLQPLN